MSVDSAAVSFGLSHSEEVATAPRHRPRALPTARKGDSPVKTFRFLTPEYRAIPVPGDTLGSRPKLATFFVRVSDLPKTLTEWMDVNPRVPSYTKRGEIKGPVVKQMIETLNSEPELFALKNQGIWILAKDVSFKRQEGGLGVAEVVLDTPEKHGVVNGGHTLYTLLDYCEGLDSEEPIDAYVRMHVLDSIDSSYASALAQGLNRSFQVNDASLVNLEGGFDKIRKVMNGKKGSDEIAYYQGDEGDVDILEVLTMMMLFDVDSFPGSKKHPNVYFGQTKKVLADFDADSPTFDKLIKALPQILILSDRIPQKAWEKFAKRLGNRKVSNRPANNRAGAPKHKAILAHFAGGTIGGKFMQGWLYPMLAAFRANVSLEEWRKGKFVWLMPPEQLLELVIDEMMEIVLQADADNKGKPAEVGRKEAAYRMCFQTVAMALAQRGKINLIAAV